MKVFQIGLDKCGTTSIHNLFQASGYESCHFMIRVDVKKKIDRLISHIIYENINNNLNPIHGLEKYTLFSDIKDVNVMHGIGGVKYFEEYDIVNREVKDCKFILNTRDPERWLNSKIGFPQHKTRGQQAAEMGKLYGLGPHEYRNELRKIWHTHINKIKSYFKRKSNLLEFNIEEDPIEKLIDFFPELNLDKENWKHLNSSRANIHK